MRPWYPCHLTRVPFAVQHQVPGLLASSSLSKRDGALIFHFFTFWNEYYRLLRYFIDSTAVCLITSPHWMFRLFSTSARLHEGPFYPYSSHPCNPCNQGEAWHGLGLNLVLPGAPTSPNPSSCIGTITWSPQDDNAYPPARPLQSGQAPPFVLIKCLSRQVFTNVSSCTAYDETAPGFSSLYKLQKEEEPCEYCSQSAVKYLG